MTSTTIKSNVSVLELKGIKTAPESAPTLFRSLTHQLELARRGLVMNTTQKLGKTQAVWPESNIPHRVAQRAISQFVVDENGCHISTYSVASHGYAQIGWNVGGGKRTGTTAHRAAWVAHAGEQIPAGMTIDHTCKVKRCVNPQHLRVLSNFENGRRTHGRDWALGRCINGHSNSRLFMTARGMRQCRDCMKLWRNRWNWKVQHGEAPYPDRLLLASEREAKD